MLLLRSHRKAFLLRRSRCGVPMLIGCSAGRVFIKEMSPAAGNHGRWPSSAIKTSGWKSVLVVRIKQPTGRSKLGEECCRSS
jgi:hypothetical protein